MCIFLESKSRIGIAGLEWGVASSVPGLLSPYFKLLQYRVRQKSFHPVMQCVRGSLNTEIHSTGSWAFVWIWFSALIAWGLWCRKEGTKWVKTIPNNNSSSLPSLMLSKCFSEALKDKVGNLAHSFHYVWGGKFISEALIMLGNNRMLQESHFSQKAFAYSIDRKLQSAQLKGQ